MNFGVSMPLSPNLSIKARNFGESMPLSPNLSIKARSHFAIFVAATLIAAKTAHSKTVVVNRFCFGHQA
jgi:hypothetical protein